ncbi:FAD-dependent oxidoreductase [Francisella adeliensis]|uniref:FAD-dependent monooxygenase n=1 Tax=Francisella adeliensis TaxID=2007306 RepID=A0A2Z4XYB3_9GAMM|nr:NAD(P)/FAD-dependent oxidoreductase [Francisella adeliensis]AXA33415.1 hypothetical protein CDH04_02845 [Francisella adeliensis]MBK2085432.1 FAD-dependent monooxygenase [Francisella adeliensis]MBK2097162.1 FAD-dependent monooxygenase [Francisella adeliensis]QIW11643.1 FAD-dependent monooxygenase [Francisella adeliensis]QIW13518.1 FAD-dependent monooxygenase [Francisella adeliensis]
MRILIVGAGPTGLTAAIELARKGHDVEIIEKHAQPSNLSKAVGIMPNSLHLFEASGVTSELIKYGVKLSNVSINFDEHEYAKIDLSAATSTYPFVLALPQNETEEILRETLEKIGVRVSFDTEFESLSENLDKVVVKFKDGAIKDYNYVIGADGIKSSVREQLEIDYIGYELEKTWSIADVVIKNWQATNTFSVYRVNKGTLAVVAPIAKNRYRVISNTENALKALPFEVSVDETFREGQFSISVRQATTYQKGRVFLAGDSAHCHSPVGGRGMNLGIADSACLAEMLTNNTQDKYTSVRHPEGSVIIKQSEKVRRFIGSENVFKYQLAKIGLTVANKNSIINRKIANMALGV